MEADVSDKPSAVRAIPIPDGFHLALLDGQRRTNLESLLAVDDALLAMLGVLDQFQQTRNTVIIFTSDNGYFFGEHRLGSKGLPYEEAHRVPLVIRYPRRLGTVGRTASEIALSLDIAPTIARFAHVHRPRVEGRSLVRVLRGRRPVRWRDGFALESWRNDGTLGYRGIRTREWKYVEYPATGELELYDLTTDPYELENRSTDPTLVELMAALRSAMLAQHAGE
jgi:arylsulfatase A-like enzyme